MISGELPPPPIAGLMEFRPVSVGVGDVVFACQPDESAYNPIGLVHGGLVCTLLDSAHGWVVRPGRRVSFAEADVRDASGKVVATASSTCLIL